MSVTVHSKEMTPEQKAAWLSSMRKRMMDLSCKLAVARSAGGDLEKIANVQQRYEDHLAICSRFIPKWTKWFLSGGEYFSKE